MQVCTECVCLINDYVLVTAIANFSTSVDPNQSKATVSLPTDTQRASTLETPHMSTSATVSTAVEPMTGWATNETSEPYHVSLPHEVALSEKKQILPAEPSTSKRIVQITKQRSHTMDSIDPLPAASISESSSGVPGTQTPANSETDHPFLPLDRLTPTVPFEEGSERSLSASLLSGPSPGESFSLTDVSACSHDESQSPSIHSHDSLPTEAQPTLDSHASDIEESPSPAVPDTVEHSEGGPDHSADGSQKSSVESDSHSLRSDSSGGESEGCSRTHSPVSKTTSHRKDQDVYAFAETSAADTPLSGHSILPQSSVSATAGAPRDHPTTEDCHSYAPQSSHLDQNDKVSEERPNSSAHPPTTTTKLSYRYM